MSLRVAGLRFPLQGKRKKNNPYHRAKNRAESRPELWPGRGGMLLPGAEELRRALALGGGVRGQEAVLAQGCGHQLT